MLYRTMRSRLKIIIVYVVIMTGITFIVTSVYVWFLCDRLMYPQRLPITRTPTIPYETVQLKTVDGVIIRGWFIPASPGTRKAPAILLLHGVADNRNYFNLDCNAPYAKQICPKVHAPYPRGTYPTLIDALHYTWICAACDRSKGRGSEWWCFLHVWFAGDT